MWVTSSMYFSRASSMLTDLAYCWIDHMAHSGMSGRSMPCIRLSISPESMNRVSALAAVCMIASKSPLWSIASVLPGNDMNVLRARTVPHGYPESMYSFSPSFRYSCLAEFLRQLKKLVRAVRLAISPSYILLRERGDASVMPAENMMDSPFLIGIEK